jgi:hypothetical protein
MQMTRRRVARLLGACVLLTGGIGGAVLLTSGTAEAAGCGSAVAAGTTCSLTGTLTLTAGGLNLTSSSALAWAGTLNGLDLSLVDPTTVDQSYLVDDATGTGAGWHVTISATQFATSGSVTLANAGTFSTTGSITSISAITAPTAACSPAEACTLPTDETTYPVAITTSATAPASVIIYDAAAATGLGSMTVGVGANPVGWWLNVPAATAAGTYTSTITLEIIAGP